MPQDTVEIPSLWLAPREFPRMHIDQAHAVLDRAKIQGQPS